MSRQPLILILSLHQVLSQLLLQVSSSTYLHQPPTQHCFCLPTQPCWPNSSTLTTFSSQLSRPLLLSIRPPASPCHDPTFSPSLCSVAQAQWRNVTWRADQPGSMMSVNWESSASEQGVRGCSIGGKREEMCEQGSVPAFGVNVTRVEDVQEALKFADEHNFKVVVKTTGHDFMGRSTAPDSLLIWLHHFKKIEFHEYFVPSDDGVKIEQAVTVTAGIQWHDLYAAAAEKNVTVIGGVSIDGTIGASGGWILGGGHSAQSPMYGLGVDNVLQFTLVLSNGSPVTASSTSNPDLFWALLGGGPGTFGIVTSVTYRTYPSTPILTAVFTANTTTSSSYKALLRTFFEAQPRLADQGWGGYSFFTGDSEDNPGAPPIPGEGRYSLSFAYLRPNSSDIQSINSTIFPFLQSLTSTPDMKAEYVTIPYPSFFKWYEMNLEGPNVGSQVGSDLVLGSRLIRRETHVERVGELVETLASLAGGFGSVLGHLVAGGAVSRVSPDSMGLNPAWRAAVTHIVLASGWEENATYAEQEKVRKTLTDLTGRLRILEPDSGCYINEADAREPDWERAFYGSHYEKLKRVKEKYDAKGRFVVRNGIGWESWQQSCGWCRKI